MAYTINANAKNVWIRDNEDTRDLSIQTDASSVYLDNGRTLEQELGEGSMVSNVATVDTSMSKVIDGTLDGAYESLVFKGKSLVNVAQPFDRGITDVWATIHLRHSLLKQSTKYYYQVFDLPSGFQHVFTNSDGSTFLGTYTTNNISTFTTNLELTSDRIVLHINDGGKNALTQEQLGKIKVMVIEYQQGMENWDIPYFTGLCDVKMPILRNVGANLFDINQSYDHAYGLPEKYFVENNKLHFINVETHRNLCWWVKVNKGERIYCSCLEENNKGKIDVRFFSEKRVGDDFINRNSWQCNGTINSTICSDEWMLLMLNTSTDSGDFVFANINVSYHGTGYEDYKTNILHTPETVTLRSLPNGVRDELNLKTGEYIKRIGEIVLNGSEEWLVFDTVTNARRFRHKPLANTKEVGTIVCISDRLPTYLRVETGQVISSYTEHVGIEINSQELWIYTEETKNMTTSDFKAWLQSNPVTVQYELAEPITTKVTLTQSEPIVKIGTELPNGVCDTYNLLTGEHIQRVGKVVLDGSEAWTKVAFPSTNTTHCYSSLKIENLKMPNVNEKNIVSDRFQTVPQESYNYSNEEMYTWRTGELLYVNILRSRLATSDVQGLKAWFKENPTTVWYELKNPIVTKKNGLPNTHGVTLPSGVVDKYNESTGVYTQNVGKIVLDGTESWSYSESSTGQINYFIITHQIASSNDGTVNVLAGDFPTYANDHLPHPNGVNNGICGRPNGSGFNIVFEDSTINTVDKAREFVKTNPITVYYPLVTPKTIDIPLINVGQVLPNGVCDTYNPITKEYVKRLESITFDGSEDEGWVSGSNTTDTYFDGWGAVIPDIKAYSSNLIFHSNLLCDRLSPSTYEQYNEHIAVQSTTGIVSIGLYSSRLTTVNLSGFKTWLKLNPLTVWYELATPEVSTVDLDLSTLYSSSPVAYENGHVILESGHDGQSLLPTLEYSTVTSKVKQIESIGEQVLRQEKQLTMLEQMLIQNIIGLDYNNTVLALNLEINEVM